MRNDKPKFGIEIPLDRYEILRVATQEGFLPNNETRLVFVEPHVKEFEIAVMLDYWDDGSDWWSLEWLGHNLLGTDLVPVTIPLDNTFLCYDPLPGGLLRFGYDQRHNLVVASWQYL